MLSLVSLAALLPALALAVPCVQFDTSWNLYAFGGEADVSLGPNTSWASPQPKPLSTAGRPPWDGEFTQCLLSQNANAMYVLGADKSDPGSVYIYDFSGDAWSKQVTTGAPAALQNSRSSAILDHDTNVIFTIPGGGAAMYQLGMDNIVATAAGALAWTDVGQPKFDTADYKVTAALASNHITYFGAPGTPAGSANMFVIHYSYFQPPAQEFTALSGSAFPATAGQAVSLPSFAKKDSGPTQMLFVPDGTANSYIVSHWTNPAAYNNTNGSPMAINLINSTQTLPGPPSKDDQAAYAASTTDLVQVDTQGNIHYLSNAVNPDYTVASGAQWTKMNYQVSGKPAVQSTSSAAPSGTSEAPSSAPSSHSAPSGSVSSDAAAASGTAKPSGAAVSILPSSIIGAVFGAVALVTVL